MCGGWIVFEFISQHRARERVRERGSYCYCGVFTKVSYPQGALTEVGTILALGTIRGGSGPSWTTVVSLGINTSSSSIRKGKAAAEADIRKYGLYSLDDVRRLIVAGVEIARNDAHLTAEHVADNILLQKE